MSFFRRIFPAGLLLLGGGLVLSSSASAQDDITPSQVLQAVQTINQTLENMAIANFSDLPRGQGGSIAVRRPRHVIVKAFEAFFRLQLLRRLNGLTPHPLPPLPAREIRPAEVKQAVNLLLSDLQELAPLFQVAPVTPPALNDSANPSMVCAELQRTVVLLGSLDLPPTAPNDVYRVADTLIAVIEEIRAALGSDAVPIVIPVNGNTPASVYEQGKVFLATLQELVKARPELTPPGGVVTLVELNHPVRPADVLDLFGAILADLTAIKARLGITEPTVLSGEMSGRTPADSLQRIVYATALLNTLRP